MFKKRGAGKVALGNARQRYAPNLLRVLPQAGFLGGVVPMHGTTPPFKIPLG
ncbi:MAG: hypothetical protein R2825_27755 [Saprospiraceae bacterium]